MWFRGWNNACRDQFSLESRQEPLSTIGYSSILPRTSPQLVRHVKTIPSVKVLVAMARTTIVLLAVSIFVSLLASVCAREVNFTDIFVDNPSLEGPIPKVAHFVFSKVKPLIWIEYASIKSAYTMLGAEKINLWVPSGTQFPGPIWQHALRIPGITIREIEMPTKIYGQNVSVLAHVSDIVRLEAIYTEGGKYEHIPLVALAEVMLQAYTWITMQ